MKALRVCRLNSDNVALAYPLIRLQFPGLSFEDWQDFALDRINRRGREESGILTVEEPRGYVLGLLVYRIGRSLAQGRTLVVEDVIALDIFRSGTEAVASTLIENIERVAQDQCCNAIRVEPLSRHDGVNGNLLLQLLAGRGFQIEPSHISKSFRGPD